MAISHPVFVILPLNSPDHVRRVFDEGIAPALKYFGYEALRIDDQAVHGGIIDTIQKQIMKAYFLIADLSYGRPNCYYELGYAQALGKSVLLLKDDRTQVHFDIANQMLHSFEGETSVKDLLETLVPRFLETRARHSSDTRNGKFGRRCIRDGFRLAAKIEECSSNNCLLTFEVCSLDQALPLRGTVKFYMHDSYVKTIQQIRVKSGIARYEEFESDDGPWTLGAEVVETGTKLELDLTTIPGAKDWWYRKAYDPL